MKRPLLATVCLLAAGIALTGCGGSGAATTSAGASPSPTPTQTRTQATVTYEVVSEASSAAAIAYSESQDEDALLTTADDTALPWRKDIRVPLESAHSITYRLQVIPDLDDDRPVTCSIRIDGELITEVTDSGGQLACFSTPPK